MPRLDQIATGESLGNAIDEAVNHVSGASTATTPAHRMNRSDSSTNTAPPVLALRRVSSGTPANGIGLALNFEVETAADNIEVGACIVAVSTDVTAASEDFDFQFWTQAAGAAAAVRATLKSTNGWLMPNVSDSATVISYGWSGLPGLGFSANSNNDGGGVFFSAGGAKVIRFAQNRFSLSANTPVLWNDTDSNAGTGTGDTAINRISPGLVGFGKGTVAGSYVGTGFAGGWKATQGITAGAAGETDTSVMASELLVLDADTSTDTVADLVPANSIVEWIAYRITTTIGTSTAFDIKVAGGNSFANIGAATTSQTTMTAGTTGILVPVLHADGYNTAAAKLRVDTVGIPSGGAAIRLTVKYRQIVPPSS